MYSTPYEGSTGKAGDPSEEVHPFAPKESRANGDPYVHYITHIKTGIDIIRFWYPENSGTKDLPVDYIFLTDKKLIQSMDGDEVPLSNEYAVQLIKKVFFEEFCNHYYQDKVNRFSFLNLSDKTIIEKEYGVY